MMRFSTILAVLALAAAPVCAQGSCTSDLTVTGTLAPGNTITISVTGSLPDAGTVLLVGETTGSTTIGLGPLGSLTVDLDHPFAVLPFGTTDANGDLSVSFDIPANIPISNLPFSTLNLQAVSLDLIFGMGPPTLESCVSDLETLSTT